MVIGKGSYVQSGEVEWFWWMSTRCVSRSPMKYLKRVLKLLSNFLCAVIQNVYTLAEKCHKCCRFDQVGFQWRRKNADNE